MKTHKKVKIQHSKVIGGFFSCLLCPAWSQRFACKENKELEIMISQEAQ